MTEAGSIPAETSRGEAPDSLEHTTVCVVDDDVGLQRSLRQLLELHGCRVVQAVSESQAIEQLTGESVSAVLLDLVLPGSDGLGTLERLRRITDAPILVMTGYGTIQLAVEAMRRGAADFLAKPVPPEALAVIIRRALDAHRLRQENRRLREEVNQRYGMDQLVGASAGMRGVFERIRAVAPTETTVFITGETGTGKELVARAIHLASLRRGGPFVAINCAAIAGELFESEVFGHERGAFTGAASRRLGLFERANGGTVFLDEVTLLSEIHQGKLLRVLQERTVQRIGSIEAIPVDVRVLAATNQPPEGLVRSGKFREDLYYRLVVFPIHLPPLRERMEDLPLLAERCLSELAARARRPAPRLAPHAHQQLLASAWPGNVRQLFNVLERAFVTCAGETIENVEMVAGPTLGEPMPARPAPAAAPALAPSGEPAAPGQIQQPLGHFLDAQETEYWRSLLARAGGHLGRVARLAGVSYPTLRRRLKALGLRHAHEGDADDASDADRDLGEGEAP